MSIYVCCRALRASLGGNYLSVTSILFFFYTLLQRPEPAAELFDLLLRLEQLLLRISKSFCALCTLFGEETASVVT